MGQNHSTQRKFTNSTTQQQQQRQSKESNHKLKLPKLSLKLSSSKSKGTSGQSSSIPSLDLQNNISSNSTDLDLPIITIKDMMVDMIHKSEHSHKNIKKNNSNYKTADYEKFFISFHQKQQQKTNNNIYNSAIQHRVAFISLIGLYESFRRIPTHILFSSIFILKIKREWLYSPKEYKSDKNNTLHTLQYDHDNEFLMLLKWKDSQNLLFFMYNDDEFQNPQELPQLTDNATSELPMDFGIEDDDNNIDEIENAFTFASNLPILSTPEIPLPQLTISPPVSDEYNYNINLEINDILFPNLPDTMSDNTMDEIIFVPPLTLQRTQEEYDANDGDEPLTLSPSDFGSVTNDIIPIKINNKYLQLSEMLNKIYDPFNENNYNSLIFDQEFYNNYTPQYGTIQAEIIKELQYADCNYRCIMEILYQSNPSIIPCKTYRELENVSITAHTSKRKLQLSEINYNINNIPSAINHIDSGSNPFYYDHEFSGSNHEVYLDYDYNITNL